MTMKEKIGKQKITEWIKEYIEEYEKRTRTRWGEVQVGFADAKSPEFERLKEFVVSDHVMPEQVLAGATIVISYFLPFRKEMAATNVGGSTSSPEWALAYEETNALFGKLNAYLIEKLGEAGVRAAVSPEATAFDRTILKSKWSQRHVAYIAGLGTFGLNNMLITKKGCCGRISSLVTDLEAEPDQPQREENCLYKRLKKCKVCVKNCPSGALTTEGYDREICFGVCKENAKKYHNFGNSYASDASGEIEDTGSEVCGKCVVNIPCAFL